MALGMSERGAMQCPALVTALLLLAAVPRALAFDVICYTDDVAYSPESSCILQYFTLNPCACQGVWIFTLLLLCVCTLLFAVYVAVLANVYRAPWTTALHISSAVNYEKSQEEAAAQTSSKSSVSGDVDEMDDVALEEDVVDTAAASPPPAPKLDYICERCGNNKDTIEIVMQGNKTYLCAGCYLYKLMLKTMPAHMFSLPLAYLYSWLGIGPLIVWILILCTLGAHVLTFALVFVSARAAFGYAVTRRVSVSEESTEVNKKLSEAGEEIIARIRPAHQNELRRALVEGEELLWAESVSVRKYLRYNFVFQITIWVLVFLPALYATLVIYFIFFSRSMIDVAFGGMIGLPLLFVCVPASLNYYMRCRATYAITNARVIRVNSTMLWFRNRVYSFPISRMSYLQLIRYSRSQAACEGEVRWRETVDVESFRQFEYVQDVNEVRGLVTEHKVIVEELDDMEEPPEAPPADPTAPPEPTGAQRTERRLRILRTSLGWLRLLGVVPILLAVPLFVGLGRSPFVFAVAAVIATWVTGAVHILYRHVDHRIQCSVCVLKMREETRV
eukprot:TRINITY_DN6812_c0_g1_i1.p1 TRINITY_DN6812_c0_g1~~TRINITY_DN6812_c0_g1_i1.p1  ORF type:complete len:560 (+),score=135.41 TRINITY_DN6812_c0_g1_i1:53-1732(+)